jgi:23S rRNA (cytosine1962-C5)-methyltransferase
LAAAFVRGAEACVRLLPGRHRRVAAGHPWVYATEVAGVEGEFAPGDLVRVVDARGRFLGRGYANPASQILVRLLTRDPEEQVDRDFFRRRLTAALEYRRRVAPKAEACRLVFGEADFLPALIVDRFGPYLVLQTLALGIDRFKDLVVDVLVELLQPRGIYERNDVNVRGLEGLELRTGYLYGQFDPLVTFVEHGLRFAADLARGQKTGFFLDQRENRLALKDLAPGARVLDAFCYTGAFALHAALFGAREVVGVDIAPAAVDLAREHAHLNGLADRCRFYAANAFDELRRLAAAGEKFDLVILDPPAFTKSKEALPGAIRGYKEINLRAMKILRPGGFLVTCSCSYHLDEAAFLEVVLAAAADAGRVLRLVELRRQARDHPILPAARETYYLKCAIFQVL